MRIENMYFYVKYIFTSAIRLRDAHRFLVASLMASTEGSPDVRVATLPGRYASGSLRFRVATLLRGYYNRFS